MVGLALDGVLNHSLIPLRVASMTSFVVGLLTLLVIAGYIVGRLAFGTDWPAGFATTTVLILASITLNAMFLGIIGEYLGRIYMQSKRRPTPVIERVLNQPGGSPPEAWLPAGARRSHERPTNRGARPRVRRASAICRGRSADHPARFRGLRGSWSGSASRPGWRTSHPIPAGSW